VPCLVAILVFLVFISLLEALGFLLEDALYAIAPSFSFLRGQWFLILGITCLVLALVVYAYFKPHPAQKHIEAYKKGKIPRQLAIAKVASTFYNPRLDGMPSQRKSARLEKKIMALHKRVKAEQTFVDEVIAQAKRNAKY
jgi:hypothetical protein